MAVRGVLVAVCGGRAVTLRSGACANVGCVCAVVLQVYDKALAVMTRVVKGTDGVEKTRRELAAEWRCEERVVVAKATSSCDATMVVVVAPGWWPPPYGGSSKPMPFRNGPRTCGT